MMNLLQFSQIYLLLFCVASSTWSIAQSMRWAAPIVASEYETSDGFAVYDSMNNAYVFTQTTNVKPSNSGLISPFPYGLNGCNDMLLAKYDISGNLIWRKVFGGFNLRYEIQDPSNPFPGCSYFFEDPHAMAYNPYNNSLIIAFDYQDSIRINGIKYGYQTTPGVPPYPGPHNYVMFASVDLNGNFNWALSLPRGYLHDFTGLTVTEAGIYWTGKTNYDLETQKDSVKKGYYIGKLDHNGNWLDARNLVYDSQGQVVRDVQIRNPTYVNNEIVVSCYLTGTEGFFGTMPFTNTYNRNLNFVYLNQTLDVQRNKVFYEDLIALTAYQSAFPPVLIPNKTSGLTLAQPVKDFDYYLQNDTLNGQAEGWSAYLLSLDQFAQLKIKKRISSNTVVSIRDGYYDEQSNLYVLMIAGYANDNKKTTIKDENGVIAELQNGDATIMLKIDSANFCTVLSIIPPFYGVDLVKDKFDRPLLLGYSDSPFSYQNVKSISPFSSDFFLLALDTYQHNSNQKHKTLIAFPNPTQGKFTIVFPDEFIDQPLELKIMSEDMKIISFKTVQSSQLLIDIDLTKERAGVYHVILKNNSEIYSCKIVVTN